MADLIELTNNWAVHIVICANNETVLDGRDVEAAYATNDEIVEDATVAALNVIQEHLDSLADLDGWFPNWHGGRYCRMAEKFGPIVADYYTRATADDEWEWANQAKESGRAPAEIETRVRAAMEAADAAHSARLDAWEKNAAEAVAAR